MERQSELIAWGLGLILGFPLLTIALSEVLAGLEWRKSALAAFVRKLRGLVLPALSLHLLVRYVLGLGSQDLATRLADTPLCAAILPALLTLLNRAAANEALA